MLNIVRVEYSTSDSILLHFYGVSEPHLRHGHLS